MPDLDRSPPAPSRRKRRWPKRLGIGIVLFAVLLGGLYAFRQPLFGRLLADTVGDALSDSLGVPVKVDRVLGSWIADARVEGVTVQTGPRSGSLVDFEAKSLVVKFSLWKILTGDIVGGIEGVEAQGLRIVMDPRLAPPDPEPKSDMSVSDVIDAVPRAFPPLNIHADVEVRHDIGTFRISGMSITCPGGPVISLDAERIVLPDPAGDVGALHAKLLRDSRGLTWQSRSTIAGIELTEVDAGADGVVRAKAIIADAPMDFSFGDGRASLKTGPMQVTAVPPWILRLIPMENARPSSGSIALTVDAPQLDPLQVTASLEGRDLVLPEDKINSIDLAARVVEGLIYLDRATARASSATLDAEGIVFDPGRPIGLASVKDLTLQAKDLRRFVETLDRPLRADISIHSDDGRTTTIDQLKLSGDGVNLEAKGSVELANAKDTPEGATLLKQMNLTWSGRAVDITVGPVQIRGHLAGKGHAYGTLENPDIEVDLEGADFLVKDIVIATVNGNATMKGDQVSFKKLTANGPGLTLSANGHADLAKETLRDVTFEMNVSELNLFHEVLARLELPALHGTLALNGQLNGAFDSPAGVFHLDARNTKIDTFALGTLGVDLTSDGTNVEVQSANAAGDWGRVSLTASVAPRDSRATVRTLEGAYGGHEIQLNAPTQVQWGDGVGLSGLDLRVLGGVIRGDASIAPRWVADLSFEGLQIAALTDEAKGTVAGHVRVNGEAINLDLTVPDLTVQGRRGTLRLEAVQGPTGIEVRTLRVEAGDAVQVNGSGLLPWQVTEKGVRALGLDRAVFDATVSIADVKSWVAAAPVGAAQATIALRGDAVTAKGFVERVVVVPDLQPIARVSFDLAAGRDAVQGRVAIEGDDRITATLTASGGMGWVWHDPDAVLSSSVPSSFDAIPVDGSLTITALDLSALASLLPADVVTELTGSASASLQFAGTIEAPRVGGTFTIAQARGVVADLPQPIVLNELDVAFADQRIEIRGGTVTYGSASVSPRGTLGMPADLQTNWDTQPLDARVEIDVPDVAIASPFVPDVDALRGSIKGTVTALGTLRDPTLGGDIVGTSLAATLRDPALEIQVPTLAVQVQGDRVILKQASVRAGNAQAELSGTFQLPSSESPFGTSPLSLSIRSQFPDLSLIRTFAPDVADVRGSLRTDIVVEGTLDAPRLTGTIDAEQLRYPLPDSQDAVVLPRLRIEATRDQIRVTEAQVAVRDVRVALSGDIRVPPDGLMGDWATQPLNASVTLNAPTLDVLELVQRDLGRLRGQIRGTITASGTANAPVLAGNIDLVGIGGRLPGDLSRIDDLSGRIALNDRTITLQNLRGSLGRSPFRIEGRASLPRDSELQLSVRLVGDNLQLMRSNELRVRANVDIEVAGPMSALVTRGRVVVADVVYAVPMDLLGGGGPASAGTGDRIELFSIEDGPLSKMKFDLAIRADRTIRIRTNMLRGNVSADLRLLGTGVAPVLDGVASFPGLLLQFPFSSLKVDAGEASFERTRPGQPRIQAEAHTTMKGYDLMVSVVGIYPDMEVKVSSNPPLAQHDAFLLLTTGATSDELAREGIARAALTRLGSIFGKRLFSGGVGPEDPDEKSIFDRFEFVQGRRISRSGQETIEAEVELTKNLFLRFERDRYDDFNAGVVWRWRFK